MTPLARLGERTQALEALFADIALTRMAGVPVLHRGLQVEAVDFALHAADEHGAEPGALGVLLTPWFMNLVWLPLERRDHPACVGLSHNRAVGDQAFEFIAAHEARFGSFDACSLFSPMFQFADHTAARATAAAVLASLRAHKPPRDEKPPPRRSFLFGRSAVAGPSV
jgi:[NiFe] hydrogenase assembly HybE family chaperone